MGISATCSAASSETVPTVTREASWGQQCTPVYRKLLCAQALPSRYITYEASKMLDSELDHAAWGYTYDDAALHDHLTGHGSAHRPKQEAGEQQALSYHYARIQSSNNSTYRVYIQEMAVGSTRRPRKPSGEQL